MVLQRKPNFKNGVVPGSWEVPKRRYEFSEWHGIREGINGRLMHRSEAGGEWTVHVDLASERHNTGAVAYRFTHRLFGPIRHWSTYQDVLIACPPGEGNLKRSQQSIEERGSSHTGQLARGIGQIDRKLRNPSIGDTRPGLRSFLVVPKPPASREIGFPESGPSLQFGRLPARAFGCAPGRLGQRHCWKPLAQTHKLLHISNTQILDEDTERPAIGNGVMNRDN